MNLRVFVSVAVTVITFVPNLKGTGTIVSVRVEPEPLTAIGAWNNVGSPVANNIQTDSRLIVP
jgi:hypothetical protein